MLTQATEVDPTFSGAFYTLGNAHFINRNRSQAIAALEKALALEPGNISIIKLLNRTRHMSDAEIATYKLSNAAASTASAGFKIWHALKLIWFFGVPLCIVLFVSQFTGSISNAVGYIVGYYCLSWMVVTIHRMVQRYENAGA